MPNLKGNNIFFVKNRVNVHWSGFSEVYATIELLKAATEKKFDYYCSISGADYPIKPIKWLINKLSKGGEFIQLQKMGEDLYAPLSRYKYYYFTDNYNRRDKTSFKTKVFLQLQQLLRKCKIKKKIPHQLYTGAAWFFLSSNCVNYIMQKIKTDKQYVAFYKTGFFSIESFFQTIIGNSLFLNSVHNNLTYADWTANPGPAIITKNHLNILKNEDEKFFARKFTDHSTSVIDEIDNVLRNS